MKNYNSVSTYTIIRGVAKVDSAILLSQTAGADNCLIGTPIQACSPETPKCDGRTETFYSISDNSLNTMFITDNEGWEYVTRGKQFEVQTYVINRGVSVLRNTISLCAANFNNKAPIVKKVLACTKDNPKCDRQSVYYQFFNSLNKLLFITDDAGYESIDPDIDWEISNDL